MAYWQTRGLRGSDLEDQINITHELYREKGLALIQKIPTPIKPIRLDTQKGVITLAYFEQKSTVDYIGIVQGVSIAFDAKETTKQSLPLANIHQHQIMFMKDFKRQGGFAFMIVYFKRHEEYYLLPLETIVTYYDGATKGGRKSIPYSAFEKKYQIPVEGGRYINYIKPLTCYLNQYNV